MIDSHCHLDHEPLFNQISEVLVRSKNAGIKKLLTICTTNESFKKILELIKLDSMIYGTFGIHPHEANKDIVNTQIIINNIKKDKKLIGVGESGLDFYYNHSDKDKQVLSFKSHIEASIELKIPIIVHSRNAENETFDILNSYKKNNPKILMHCFTGSFQFAEKLLAIFVETGMWMRAQWYPKENETHWRQSVDREVLQTRSSVGICDVTTLGKIDIQGADAAERAQHGLWRAQPHPARYRLWRPAGTRSLRRP